MSNNKTIVAVIALVVGIMVLGGLGWYLLSGSSSTKKVGGVDLKEAYELCKTDFKDKKGKELSVEMFEAIAKSIETSANIKFDDWEKIEKARGVDESKTKGKEAEFNKKSKEAFDGMFGDNEKFKNKKSVFIIFVNELDIDSEGKKIRNAKIDLSTSAADIKTISGRVNAVDATKKLCTEETYEIGGIPDKKASLFSVVFANWYDKYLKDSSK